MTKSIATILLFGLCLLISTVSLANTNGGGGGFIMHNAMNLESVIIDDFGIFDDSAVTGFAEQMTGFDELTAAAVVEAYNPEFIYKVQDYYSETIDYADQTLSMTDFEIAAAAMTASVLNAYGNYGVDEAVEAVVFDPNFSAVEFQDIIDNSFYK